MNREQYEKACAGGQRYFTHEDFSGADFREANCTSANFWGSNCAYADFKKADCTRANFCWADCTRADFWRANCTRADFLGADCKYANFRGANLTNADFRRAKNIETANFTGAILNGAIGLRQNTTQNTTPGKWTKPTGNVPATDDYVLCHDDVGYFVGRYYPDADCWAATCSHLNLTLTPIREPKGWMSIPTSNGGEE